tara:strand:+ start:2157 stop:3224 length:1068 start_codon:yes stop_codon:yes gene_type:complete
MSLKKYFEEAEVAESQTNILEEAEEIIEGLEHFLGDEEDVSMEGRLGDLFKERKESIKDKLHSLFKGAEGVQSGFTKILEDKRASLRNMGDEERELKLTSIAPYVYDSEKRRYRLDLQRAIRDDISFVEDLFKLMERADDGMKNNVSLLQRAPNTRGSDDEKKEAWRVYWEEKANPKVISAGTVFLKSNISEKGLYNTSPEMSSGFKSDKQGSSFTKQTQHIKLDTGKEKAPPSARREIEEGLTMSKRDMDSFLSAAIDFSSKTAEAVKLVEVYGERYHPRKGSVQKELIKAENEHLERIGFNAYVSGINTLIPANVSLITTMDKFPMQVVARNLKLLRVFVRFSEQFFEAKEAS